MFSTIRRSYEALAARVFAGGWGARLAYDLGLQGNVTVSHHRIVVDAPARWPRPLRIAFVSDFHAGPLTDARLLAAVFQRVRELQPDVVLLGGDFVGLDSRHVAALCDSIRQLTAPLGTFAVIGNHDIWHGDAGIRHALEEVGVRVLRNSSVRLPPPYEEVVIGGLDDPCIGRPDAERTFEGMHGIRVAVMHSPAGITLLRSQGIAVAFAGHTHGGQVCLPGGHALFVPRHCWRWKSGHFAVAGSPGGMVVSRGIGCTTLPVRLACPSEINFCTLESA